MGVLCFCLPPAATSIIIFLHHLLDVMNISETVTCAGENVFDHHYHARLAIGNSNVLVSNFMGDDEG